MKRRHRKPITTIEEALRDPDALPLIGTLVDLQSSGGRWFRLMYAAILEVNSAGPGILFDRFTLAEVRTIQAEYARLGARDFAQGLAELIAFVEERAGPNPSEDQLLALSVDPGFALLDRRHTLCFEHYRQEMERTLSAHLNAHPDELRKP